MASAIAAASSASAAKAISDSSQSFSEFAIEEILNAHQDDQIKCIQCSNGSIWIQRVHELLDHPNEGIWSKILQTLVLSLIALSTFQLILSSVRELEDWSGWDAVEYLVSIFFSIELAARFIVSAKKLKFCFTVMNIIDILAIVPFYVGIALQGQNSVDTLRILRIVRLVRIFRLLKVGRYLGFLKVFKVTLVQSSEPLFLLLLFVFLLAVIFGSLVASIEAGECDVETGICTRSDGSISPYKNYLVGIYWALTTLTTVGYGDTFPVEHAGRAIANITMITGIMAFALPLVVIGSNFQSAYEEYNAEKRKVGKKKRNSQKQVETYAAMARSIILNHQQLSEELKNVLQKLEEKIEEKATKSSPSSSVFLQTSLQSARELFNSKLEILDTSVAAVLTRSEHTEKMIAHVLQHSPSVLESTFGISNSRLRSPSAAGQHNAE